MARVTVEDCIDKVESPYELVLVAKERATQLNSGIEPTIERDNDKNTVISLREIAEEKIKVSDLTESAVYKLRKHVEQVDDGSEDDEEIGDDFENMYKGEISKSGTPILPSKRARKTPEKIQVSQEDLAEVQNSTETSSAEGSDRIGFCTIGMYFFWYGGVFLLWISAVLTLATGAEYLRKALPLLRD